MTNYFNSLNFRQRLIQLKQGSFIHQNQFCNQVKFLENKKIVIVGCGAQGFNQGLNLRDSGLNVTYALREESIKKKSLSWIRAKKKNFFVGTLEELIPSADLVINLTPDKEHAQIIKKLQNLMKKNAVLGYSHGFNIVEMGERIRDDITVIMVAPKCPGTEVRQEFSNGFGVPTLIAVHKRNDPFLKGLDIAKSWAYGLGSHKAGVLKSSFIAEVKSDLMGEQTILCGMLQACSLVCYEHLIEKGYDPKFSATLLQFGWEKLTESLKEGGITLLLDRISNSAKLRVCQLSEKLKKILIPLYSLHMDDIISGVFSKNMMHDWEKKDKQLYIWRNILKNSEFENARLYQERNFSDQEYFDKSTLMIAMLKAGIELSFEIMINTGITPESAYYESLHELPLIANTISRKRLYEMNLVISDTAEYGCHLFSSRAIPLLKNFLNYVKSFDIGESIPEKYISNSDLLQLNTDIQKHPIEIVGKKLRSYMFYMKKLALKN